MHAAESASCGLKVHVHVQRMAEGGLLWHPSLVSPSLLRTVEHWSGHEAHNQVSAVQPPVRLQQTPQSCC